MEIIWFQLQRHQVRQKILLIVSFLTSGLFLFLFFRFSINIQTGPALRPSDDVNLHLSVRPNEQAIIRNHKVNQTYGQEERHGGCPIVPGSPFEILILAEATSFKVSNSVVH